MPATLIVDGYNAINAIPEIRKKIKKSLAEARKAILEKTAKYARSSGYITDYRVVFDGSNRYRYLDMLELPHGRTHVFSRTGRGDETIIETVKKYARRGKVVLASNDNYVRNNARAYGAALISSEELVLKKKRPKKPKKSTNKYIDQTLADDITREQKERFDIQ